MALNMQPNYIAGILSKRTGKPVKWQFTRREDFCGRGHGQRTVRGEGRLQDGRRRSRPWPPHPGSPRTAIAHSTILSRTRRSAISVRSATAPSATYARPRLPLRAEPERLFLHRAFLGHVAEALGMDPTELALKNDGCRRPRHGRPRARKRARGFRGQGQPQGMPRGRQEGDRVGRKVAPARDKRDSRTERCTASALPGRHEWGDSAGLGGDRHTDRARRRIGAYLRPCGATTASAPRRPIARSRPMSWVSATKMSITARSRRAALRPMTPDSSTNLSVNGCAIRNAARQLKRKILETATTPKDDRARPTWAISLLSATTSRRTWISRTASST